MEGEGGDLGIEYCKLLDQSKWSCDIISLGKLSYSLCHPYLDLLSICNSNFVRVYFTVCDYMTLLIFHLLLGFY